MTYSRSVAIYKCIYYYSQIIYILEYLVKEWEASKQMGNIIECDNKEEISFEMTKQNACCLLECELPLR